jgi:hypothetical protein
VADGVYLKVLYETFELGVVANMYVGCLKRSVNGIRKTKQDPNKLTLLAIKIIVILHNTLLAMFIKLLKTVSKGLFNVVPQ